jgi:hypothetical protein
MSRPFTDRQKRRPAEERTVEDLFETSLRLSSTRSNFLKRLATLGCILLMALPTRALAKRPPKASYKESIQCDWMVPKGKDSEVLPASITREAVLEKLHPAPLLDSDEDFERVCGILARELPAQPGRIAVVLVSQRFTQNQFGGLNSSDVRVQIGVLAEGEQPGWIATTTAPIHLPEASLVELDFARYRVAPDVTAFGLRWQRHFMYAGGGGMNQFLELFLVNGATVAPILSTLMRSSSITAGAWRKDKTRDHRERGSETAATISILKTMTLGHFDLLKKHGKKQAALKWNGDGYALMGKDPVEDVNVEE